MQLLNYTRNVERGWFYLLVGVLLIFTPVVKNIINISLEDDEYI